MNERTIHIFNGDTIVNDATLQRLRGFRDEMIEYALDPTNHTDADCPESAKLAAEDACEIHALYLAILIPFTPDKIVEELMERFDSAHSDLICDMVFNRG